jgi:hypothetical protein
MFRLLQPFKKPKLELVTDDHRPRDPQYEPPKDHQGWLGDPSPGSPEHWAWLRWMSE